MRGLMRLWLTLCIGLFQLGGIANVYAQNATSNTSTSTSSTDTSSTSSTQSTSTPSNSEVSVQISYVTFVSTLVSVQTVTTGAPGAPGSSSTSRTSSRSTVYQTQTVPPLVQPTYSSSLSQSKMDMATTVSLALLLATFTLFL